jgi:septal ring factor EnvC (AmiA/AmiB activator)
MKKTRNDFGNRKKESKKSFYGAAVAALVCTLVVGAVYYETKQNAETDLAQSGESGQEATVAGESAVDESLPEAGDGDESVEASTITNAETAKPADEDLTTEKAEKSKKKNVEVKANKSKKKSETSGDKQATVKNTFQEENGLSWPVKGDVLMKFSENNTIYFKTLAQYKSNPAIEISAEEGTKVIASAAGVVKEISEDSVTGKMITTDIGSDYTITYGQLTNLKVSEGDEVKEGQLLGVVAKPTKYFSEEGSNLYFQVKENGTAIDPLLLLN